MKVVLFCGGLGLRMRVGDDPRPKPMMTIGDRPVLWHIMRYYAHFGHTDFILCLGYGAQVVKDYFLNYQETASNDFILSDGGRRVDMISTDTTDWTITFVDTGISTEIGERLRRVRKYLGDDEFFLAHYGDVLTDAPMNDVIATFQASAAVGSLMAIRPPGSFHVVLLADGLQDGPQLVTGFQPATDLPLRINGGYFVFRQGIFDYLAKDEDLVADACEKAAHDGKLLAIPYDGFWRPMDTLKERAELEELYRSGQAPWTVWRTSDEPPADLAPAPVIR